MGMARARATNKDDVSRDEFEENQQLTEDGREQIDTLQPTMEGERWAPARFVPERIFPASQDFRREGGGPPSGGPGVFLSCPYTPTFKFKLKVPERIRNLTIEVIQKHVET